MNNFSQILGTLFLLTLFLSIMSFCMDDQYVIGDISVNVFKIFRTNGVWDTLVLLWNTVLLIVLQHVTVVGTSILWIAILGMAIVVWLIYFMIFATISCIGTFFNTDKNIVKNFNTHTDKNADNKFSKHFDKNFDKHFDNKFDKDFDKNVNENLIDFLINANDFSVWCSIFFNGLNFLYSSVTLYCMRACLKYNVTCHYDSLLFIIVKNIVNINKEINKYFDKIFDKGGKGFNENINESLNMQLYHQNQIWDILNIIFNKLFREKLTKLCAIASKCINFLLPKRNIKIKCTETFDDILGWFQCIRIYAILCFGMRKIRIINLNHDVNANCGKFFDFMANIISSLYFCKYVAKIIVKPFVKHFNALLKFYLVKLYTEQICLLTIFVFYAISYSLLFDKENIKTENKSYTSTMGIIFYFAIVSILLVSQNICRSQYYKVIYIKLVSWVT